MITYKSLTLSYQAYLYKKFGKGESVQFFPIK